MLSVRNLVEAKCLNLKSTEPKEHLKEALKLTKVPEEVPEGNPNEPEFRGVKLKVAANDLNKFEADHRELLESISNCIDFRFKSFLEHSHQGSRSV